MANKQSILIISFVSHRTVENIFKKKNFKKKTSYAARAQRMNKRTQKKNNKHRIFFVGFEKLSNAQKKWQFVLKNELNEQQQQHHTHAHKIIFFLEKSDSCCVLWLVCFYDVLLMATSIISHIWKWLAKHFSRSVSRLTLQIGKSRRKHLWKKKKLLMWINWLRVWFSSRVLNWSKCLFHIEIRAFTARTHSLKISVHMRSSFLCELGFICHYGVQFTRSALDNDL